MENDKVLKRLDIKDIYIPEDLQRLIRYYAVKNIIDKFDYKSLGRILCNYRDGKYYVIDGQHRLMALREMGFKSIECDVYFNLTQQEEAQIYKNLANTSQHNRFEKYKADLVLGDKIAIEIQDFMKNAGLEISHHKNSKNISCINDIYKCYKDDKELLKKVLAIFKTNFDLKNGISGVELKGMFLFLKQAIQNNNFDINFFVKRLSMNNQSQILRQGAAQKEANRTVPAKGYALALLNIYNHNKIEKNRIGLNLLS